MQGQIDSVAGGNERKDPRTVLLTASGGLFVAQRYDWLNHHRPARRQVTGQ